MNSNTKRNQGFTIIEVLIVLAIAGLIMLIVFLAVPALRRNQQNSTMRTEASRLLSAVTEYEANANGAQVNSQAILTTVYNTTFPAGSTAQQLTPTTSYTAAPAADGASKLVIGTCVGTAATASAGRTYALEFQLNGGQHACLQS
jgi:prepilin-type N-terminal cleavage/methylation domain-containing protein